MKIIVHPGPNGSVLVTAPVAPWPILAIAEKDVPAGDPFLIVEDSDLPTDPSHMVAVSADFSQPDGHGLTPADWIAKHGQEDWYVNQH